MTPGELVAKAHRAWVEEKRTGTLLFNYRHGTLKHVEHQVVEFPDGLESARGQNGRPACPACRRPLASRDGGTMWTCDACALKRTEHQLKGGR